MTQTLTIPGTLPGLNELIAANRSRTKGNVPLGALMKREWTQVVGLYVTAQKISPVQNYPVHLAFRWIEPNRKRDPDNIASGKKFILDALVETGILLDDRWKQVNGFRDRFECEPRNPRIIVEIQEAEGTTL